MNKYHDGPGESAGPYRVMHSKYDNFFKAASGLDIADKGDGNVEAPCGWFALIDMRGDKRDEVLEALTQYGIYEFFDDDVVPDPAVYVTTTNDSGIIWAYEFQTRGAAELFYAPFEAVYEHWMGDDELDNPSIVRSI